MKRVLVVLLALSLCILPGCTAKEAYSENTFYAMNTFMTVRLSTVSENGDSISEARIAEIHRTCEGIIREVEAQVSVTDADSDTVRFNDSDGGIEDCGEHFLSLLERSVFLSRLTDRAFAPTLRPLSALWDFGGEGYVPTDDEIDALLCHTDPLAVYVNGNAALKTDPELQLDFGAVAKGYAAQLLILYLESTECRGGLVSLGGNVGLFGDKADSTAYKVGLTDPRNKDAVLGYLSLTDGFVSVSGDYERYFEADGIRYHHILDPKRGSPAKSGLISTAVIAKDGALADALSTALFVMGAEDAIAFYESGEADFEAILITEDKEVILTEGIAELFALSAETYTVISSEEGMND